MIDEETVRQLIDMHAVYRMYSASGRLLYVGMTNGLARRLDEHTGRRWFPQIATISLEWFPNKSTAGVAEKRAIRRERPAYNIIHRPELVPLRPSMAEALASSGQLTLAEAVMAGFITTIAAARKAAGRPGFPAPAGRRGAARLYDVADLKAYRARKREVA